MIRTLPSDGNNDAAFRLSSPTRSQRCWVSHPTASRVEPISTVPETVDSMTGATWAAPSSLATAST